MIHLLVGLDVVGAKAHARKEAVGELVLFGEHLESFENAPSYVSSQGLFSSEITLLLDRPLETPDGKTLIKKSAQMLHESDTAVFVVETALSVEDKKLFPKGVKTVDFGKKEAPFRPLPFALSDAFLKNDRKNAWIEYQKLRLHGISLEEIHGTLSWGVRSTLLALKTKTPEASGMKPFVYSKSRRIGEQRGQKTIEALSRKLVAVYHQARAGKVDMGLGIEKLILEKIKQAP